MWEPKEGLDPRLLDWEADGEWWETLDRLGITLLVTREYEHLFLALRFGARGPEVTYLRLPHPSGIAVDRERGAVHVACTRNPNLLMEMRPISGFGRRLDAAPPRGWGKVLLPVRARFLPGSMYLHDLALIGGKLHGNAVGWNAVVRLGYESFPEPVWWPKSIEPPRGCARNLLQLNSIAAGKDLRSSFFSSSAERPSRLRPGDPRFPVDGRGVVFSGRTREPVLRGLTRPHSARLHEGRLWVDNSGYGEVGFGDGGRFVAAARFPGWTRGLCFFRDTMFVGVSRVLPRFESYAPGVDPRTAVCGIYACSIRTARVVGRLVWPRGDQVFGIDWISAGSCRGLPLRPGQDPDAARRGFYLFRA